MTDEKQEKEKPQEEEEEDENFKLFLKNREKHFFFRPIFCKVDLESNPNISQSSLLIRISYRETRC